jgi:hypothetical protein
VGVVYSQCIACGNSLERSTEIVPGSAVVRCPRCRWFCLEGDGKRFYERERGLPGDVVQELRERAHKLEAGRRMDVQEREIFESESTDPRWRWL